MKLVVNTGVRREMDALQVLFERHNSMIEKLSSPSLSFSAATDIGADRMMIERLIVASAARLLSHGSRGKLFHHMTEGEYGGAA